MWVARERFAEGVASFAGWYRENNAQFYRRSSENNEGREYHMINTKEDQACVNPHFMSARLVERAKSSICSNIWKQVETSIFSFA